MKTARIRGKHHSASHPDPSWFEKQYPFFFTNLSEVIKFENEAEESSRLRKHLYMQQAKGTMLYSIHS